MRKILLAAVTLAFPFALVAQTISPDYQDGKIWFKVKDDVRINLPYNEDPQNLPAGTLPFLVPIVKNHQGTTLSRPFYAAKNSPVLQRTYLLRFTDYAAVMDIINDLKASGKVEYAERVPLDHSCLTPNDPSYGSQWHLATINAATAWNFFSTGSTIKIAIVDNAVDRTHQDLSGNLWTNPGEIANNGIDDDGDGYIDDINGYDVADNDNNPNPPNNTFDHGTHCAGIADAKTNNGIGVAGIGFSLKLMAVKATANSANPSTVTNGYDGIVYAVSAGARVISLSWGGTSNSTTAQNIITWASQSGCIIVAAAGNSNTNTMFYPAAYTECIAVAATNSNDTKASFSNYGSWVDISAPGNNIYSTLPSNQYGNMSGTSMACPLVAGLCGLMLSLNPGLTSTDVKNCLYSSAVNINSVNPSYSGQLGAGRIDAAAAMSCISSTLNWAPVANFTANVTSVVAGGNVHFTDQSVYNPTTWSWSFPGGTPATFNGQNPPNITYSTPGVYNVSLTVSNANGNNTHTATNYITVTAPTGCQKINLPAPAGWHPVNYYTGSTVGQNGWINGLNITGDKQVGMYFDASAYPYTQLVDVWVAFGLGRSTNPAKIVPLHIYDGTTGAPTTLLGTVNTTMGQVRSDVSGGFYTDFSFVNTPVNLPASKKFFVTVDVTNLNWTTNHDTLSIVSNTNGETTPSAAWEQLSTNAWKQYNAAGSNWALNISLYIHPFLTNPSGNANATFTPGNTTICAGNQVNFDATGSTYQDTLLWYFPGANPVVSNNVQQSVIFNNPGSYQAILYVIGGACDLFDSAFANITVNANPVLTVSAAPSATICNGGTVNLSASGATTYTWSPGTFLNTTTGANVISTPTTSITYDVSGTGANGCSSTASIDIDVLNPPSDSMTLSSTSICPGQSIVFDGSNSAGAGTFSWSFPGGTPSSSNASSATITYSTQGTYTATLVVQNACGSDTLLSQQIVVNCTGIANVDPNQPSAFYNAQQSALDVQLPQSNEGFTLVVFNNLGQVVRTVKANGGDVHQLINTADLATGMYTLRAYNSSVNYTMKFVKN